MNNIDFSVVIPAFNNLNLFKSALESIRYQRNVSIEIIVVDDSCNTNDIEQYVSTLCDSRIRYHHNKPSLGAVPNWNYGLRNCHGNNIMIVHHDEALATDDFLYKVKNKLQTYDVVICNLETHNANGHVYRIYPNFVKDIARSFPSLLFCINVFGPCAVIAIRRGHLDFFDEKLKWFVDVEWYYRLIKGRYVCYFPDVTILSHPGHKNQITNTIDVNQESKNDAVWLRKKYGFKKTILFAAFFQIYILHNPYLHKFLRKISGRC